MHAIATCQLALETDPLKPDLHNTQASLILAVETSLQQRNSLSDWGQRYDVWEGLKYLFRRLSYYQCSGILPHIPSTLTEIIQKRQDIIAVPNIQFRHTRPTTSEVFKCDGQDRYSVESEAPNKDIAVQKIDPDLTTKSQSRSSQVKKRDDAPSKKAGARMTARLLSKRSPMEVIRLAVSYEKQARFARTTKVRVLSICSMLRLM